MPWIVQRIVLLVCCVSTIGLADDTGGGRVLPNEGGISGFVPEWDPDHFNLAAYMENLPPEAVQWYQHVQTLSNPWFEGRRPGTPGDELTVAYMIWYFQKAGLEPAFVNAQDEPAWRQPFSFSLPGQTPTVHEAAVRMQDASLERGKDFDVLANCGSDEVDLPISFVGYAIEEGPEGYTSFAEDDRLDGRAAIVLRYEPLNAEGNSHWSEEGFSRHATMRRKMNAIQDRGAGAVLLVNPPEARDGREGLETIFSSSGFGRAMDVPVIHLTPERADEMIQAASKGAHTLTSLKAASDQLDSAQEVWHLGDDDAITIHTHLEASAYDTWNVAGVLPGQGELQDEWVVVGGHYDHLGHGYTGSRTPGDDRVHPGADDNASGIGTVLVLADKMSKLASQDSEPRRSLLFVGFSGEEAGLHGSSHFIAEAPIDLDATNLMLNLDMMGRIQGDTVALTGTGTAVEFDEMLPRLVEPTGMTVRTTASGLGPSDHSNFYRAEVPVLFFFTGLHDDYHTPEDVAWRVNPEGTAKVINLCVQILNEAVHRTQPFTYAESTSDTPARRTGASVRLGVMPSYTNTDQPGVLLDGVSEGTSASDAGLLAGDIITAWDGEPIEGGSDLMKHLRGASPGDRVVLRIVREGNEMDVEVELKGR